MELVFIILEDLPYIAKYFDLSRILILDRMFLMVGASFNPFLTFGIVHQICCTSTSLESFCIHLKDNYFQDLWVLKIEMALLSTHNICLG